MRLRVRARLRQSDSHGWAALAWRPPYAALRSPAALALLMAMLFCWSGAAAPKKKALPSKPIDLNHATLEQLEELPGVGPVMAHSILQFRQQSGPFERVDDLLAIRGISRGRLQKIGPYVFVGKKKPGESPAAQSRAKPPARSSSHDL